ncbi:enoyl-[acyl-carrier-protein] reductase FabL [candidate division KSB1 bacterium]|nr:enoyl-[acyl-carrier-protein] reductase FabL [candidate division KSB1 bacterium]
MQIDFTGKTALITGGSRGIGRAIAIRLAQAGADVAINYFRKRNAAEETVAQIEATGRRALAIKANVAVHEQVHHIIDEIANTFGKIDILISNAASGVLKPAMELTEHHWHWTLDINAGTLLPLIQHSKPLMPKTGGKVVAVSSLGSIRAIPNYTAVGASKAALESLVRHLAVELAPENININVVSPGVIDTDALKHFPNREVLLEGSRKRTPAGRLTTPEDVADVVLFLCSDLARMIHGQTIIVDGGYSIVA